MNHISSTSIYVAPINPMYSALDNNLRNWCVSAINLEKPGRIIAAERIQHCYDQGSTSLDLQSLGLTSIPNDIGILESLTQLRLDNNNLTILPDSLGNLGSLEELDLRFNQLTVLPNSFENLGSLKRLYLRNNQLTTIPTTLANLRTDCIIDVEKNLLTAVAIQTFIDALTQIHQLDGSVGPYVQYTIFN